MKTKILSILFTISLIVTVICLFGLFLIDYYKEYWSIIGSDFLLMVPYFAGIFGILTVVSLVLLLRELKIKRASLFEELDPDIQVEEVDFDKTQAPMELDRRLPEIETLKDTIQTEIQRGNYAEAIASLESLRGKIKTAINIAKLARNKKAEVELRQQRNPTILRSIETLRNWARELTNQGKNGLVQKNDYTGTRELWNGALEKNLKARNLAEMMQDKGLTSDIDQTISIIRNSFEEISIDEMLMEAEKKYLIAEQTEDADQSKKISLYDEAQKILSNAAKRNKKLSKNTLVGGFTPKIQDLSKKVEKRLGELKIAPILNEIEGTLEKSTKTIKSAEISVNSNPTEIIAQMNVVSSDLRTAEKQLKKIGKTKDIDGLSTKLQQLMDQAEKIRLIGSSQEIFAQSREMIDSALTRTDEAEQLISENPSETISILDGVNQEFANIQKELSRFSQLEDAVPLLEKVSTGQDRVTSVLQIAKNRQKMIHLQESAKKQVEEAKTTSFTNLTKALSILKDAYQDCEQAKKQAELLGESDRLSDIRKEEENVVKLRDEFQRKIQEAEALKVEARARVVEKPVPVAKSAPFAKISATPSISQSLTTKEFDEFKRLLGMIKVRKEIDLGRAISFFPGYKQGDLEALIYDLVGDEKISGVFEGQVFKIQEDSVDDFINMLSTQFESWEDQEGSGIGKI